MQKEIKCLQALAYFKLAKQGDDLKISLHQHTINYTGKFKIAGQTLKYFDISYAKNGETPWYRIYLDKLGEIDAFKFRNDTLELYKADKTCSFLFVKSK